MQKTKLKLNDLTQTTPIFKNLRKLQRTVPIIPTFLPKYKNIYIYIKSFYLRFLLHLSYTYDYFTSLACNRTNQCGVAQRVGPGAGIPPKVSNLQVTK